jgi:hypothetical protein
MDGRFVWVKTLGWGAENDYRLSKPLLQTIHSSGIVSLDDAKAQTPQSRGRSGWKSGKH